MMQLNVTTLRSEKQVEVSFTDKPVSAWGGLAIFGSYAKEVGLVEAIRSNIPFELTSPNATDPVDMIMSFFGGVIAGSKRFAHLEVLRQDKVVKAIFDIKKYPADSTFIRFFNRYGYKESNAMFSGLMNWQFKLVKKRDGGYTLDLDSSVIERYGKQEGSKKGYNPKKPGRPSHNPVIASLGELPLIVHAWLRSGNTGSARGAGEFLKEALVFLPQHINISIIRGDSAFGNGKFLDLLEAVEMNKSYVVALRLTGRLQGKISKITDWKKLDAGIEVAETTFKASTWEKERRAIILREHVPEKEDARGKTLFDDPCYLYQAFATNLDWAPEEIWRFYRKRADMENRIRELKWDYGINGFCVKKFFPPEIVFRLICFLHNLIQLFQKRLGLVKRKTLATLRATLFACGAILGRTGHKFALRLSVSAKRQKRFSDYFYKFFFDQNLTATQLE